MRNNTFTIIAIAGMLALACPTNAQLRTSGGMDRSQHDLRGTVKSVTEAHWDELGNFMSRTHLEFSRTGRTLEQTDFFGEADDQIAATSLYNYNQDGRIAGYYHYERLGEKHNDICHFAHWIATFDKGNHLVKKTAYNMEMRYDKYGNIKWDRSKEELFLPHEGVSDTIFAFDKKTDKNTTMTYPLTEVGTSGNGKATFSFNSKGDTLAIVYHDPTGRFPSKVKYSYKYAKTQAEKLAEEKAEAEKAAAEDNGAERPKGRAVSPVTQKREEALKKKGEKEEPRIEEKTVETIYNDEQITITRFEKYDDSSKLVLKIITRNEPNDKKEVNTWKYNPKRQLSETETTRWVGNEMTYQIKDRYMYDRKGNLLNITRNGKSITRTVIWRYTYHEFDDDGNWTSCTLQYPNKQTSTTSTSPKGNTIEKITYESETTKTITRIIKYYQPTKKK